MITNSAQIVLASDFAKASPDTSRLLFEHIYLHWPFCKSRCHYCDFIALAKHEEFYKSYHQALCKEIELVTKNFETKQKIKTIFIGGGTPSLYPLNLLEDLFKILRNNFDLNEVQELTLEANPADITKEKLQAWNQVGINRLSLGIQILDDDILKKLNRQQTIHDALNAIELAPTYFKNISIDLILGLPDVTKQIWNQTLSKVISWPITHISIYFLTVYEKTPLYFKVEKNEIKLTEEDILIETYKQTIDFLKQNNFFQMKSQIWPNQEMNLFTIKPTGTASHIMDSDLGHHHSLAIAKKDLQI